MPTKSVTMADVAQRAKVSISTVSRVINGTIPVSDDLRRRVFAAIEALNYEPIRVSSTAAEGKIASIAVIVMNLRSPFFSEIISGIQDVCFQHGYTAVIFNSEGDQEKEIIHTNEIPYHSAIQGVIFSGIWAWEHHDHIVRLYERGMPVCMINRVLPNLPLDRVQVDQSIGTYEATTHLLNLGHRNIGVVMPKANAGVPAPDQLAGFRRAMKDYNVPVDKSLVIEVDFSTQGGYQAGMRLLRRSNRPTAIFARADRLALGVLRAAHDLKLSLPQDLSVVGYGDEPDARYWSPALTTIRQPQFEMGTQAAELLFERINNRGLPPRQTIFQPRLIERESTAALEPISGFANKEESFHG